MDALLPKEIIGVIVQFVSSFQTTFILSLSCKELQILVWSSVRRVDSAWLRGSVHHAGLVQEAKYWSYWVKALCKVSKSLINVEYLEIGYDWICPKWNYRWTTALLHSGLIKSSAKTLKSLHICEVPKTCAESLMNALEPSLDAAVNLHEVILYRTTITEKLAFKITNSRLPSLQRLLIYESRCVGQWTAQNFFKAILSTSWMTNLTHLSFDVGVFQPNFVPILVSSIPILSRLEYLNLPNSLGPLFCHQEWSIGLSKWVLSFDGVFVARTSLCAMPHQRIVPASLPSSGKLDPNFVEALSASQRRDICSQRSSGHLHDAVHIRGRMLLFIPVPIIDIRFACELLANPTRAASFGVDFEATDRQGRNVLHLQQYRTFFKVKLLENLPAEVASKLLMTPALQKPCALEYNVWSSEEFKKILNLINYKLPEDSSRVKQFLTHLTGRDRLLAVLEQDCPWIKSLDILLDSTVIGHFFSWENARSSSPAVALIRFVARLCIGPDERERAARLLITRSLSIIHTKNYYNRYPGYDAFSAIQQLFASTVPGLEDMIQEVLTPDQYKKLQEYRKRV